MTSGIILFYWVRDYFCRRNLPTQKDFIPNLLESLRDQKLLKENSVELLSQISFLNAKQLVRIKIENQAEYFLITGFFGSPIFQVWDKDDVPNWVREKLNEANKPKESQI